MNNDKIVAPNFCYVLATNFPLFFAFYLILPILPFYLKGGFMVGKSMIGFILSCYVLTALYIHPSTGYLLGTFTRHPLYLVAYFIFTAIFGGCMVATVLTLFIVLCVVHSFAFGMVTVAESAILVDILPSSRRGEGIGYYGLTNNIAVSFGPAIGLFMRRSFTCDVIFSYSLLSGSLGFIMAYMVKTPYKQLVKRGLIPLGRFFLVKGTQAGISLLLLSIPYGMTTTYATMYAAEVGIDVNPGSYFTFMVVGLTVSRLFSKRQMDKRRITLVISLGMCLAAATFFPLTALKELMHWNPVFSSYFYIGIALSQGVAFGTMLPAFSTLFVNLAPNDQRGTATFAYLTSWDVGIGVGLVAGGSITQELGGFSYTYLSGTCLTMSSTFLSLFKAGPHFNRYKLR